MYLLHNGESCSTRVSYYGKDIDSIRNIALSIFSKSDYVIGGLLIVGAGFLAKSAFTGFNLKNISKLLASVFIARAGEIKIADTFSYRDLIELLCKDPNGFTIVNGKMVYGNPNSSIEKNYSEEYDSSEKEYSDVNLYETLGGRSNIDYSNNKYDNNYNKKEEEKYNSEYKTNEEENW